MLDPRRLAEVRLSLRLSQEGMARLLGVSFASVNRWENGHSLPTGPVMEVYRALDVALRAGKTSRDILGEGGGDPGKLLYRIFRAAYG
jgi:transcriptional regulator with XRE-family HTH domain